MRGLLRSFLRLEDASANGELRDVVIGFAEDWTLLFVVHALVEDDRIRIISARPATAPERRLYEDGE
ncbi:BrnT family toxin [Edaphobacter aggregans]|uniref:BrnT family toxin n=1 Tax=Edaphobacter aggregans TaxID=570835 RepID=UPI000B2F75E6|nr:BrnT family toxin [Edaphobacter aggregans]